jgi:HNH endonuclease
MGKTMKTASAKAKYTQANTPEDYLNQRLDKSGDCWIYTGGKDKDGYGQVHCAKTAKELEVTRAHQMAYKTWVDDYEKGLMVCHTCDNPSCCNPKHLFVGTALDNNKDMNNKGRNVSGMLGKGIDQKYVCSQHGIKDSMTLTEELGVTFSNICHVWRKHGLKGRRHFARTA